MQIPSVCSSKASSGVVSFNMRPAVKFFAASVLALAVATGAVAQDAPAPIVIASNEPLTLEAFADALRLSTGRPVLIGLSSQSDFLRQDRGHRLKINWNGSLATLMNGVAPRFGVQWAEEGDAILLFDVAAARPKAPVRLKPIETAVAAPPQPAPIPALPVAAAVPVPAPAAVVPVAAPGGAVPAPMTAAVPSPMPPQFATQQPPAMSASVATAPQMQPLVFAKSAPIVQALPASPTVQRSNASMNRPTAERPSSRAREASPSAQGESQLAVIRSANQQSTQVPTSSGFVNSTIFYDYMPGAIYELHTSPRFISTIALRPGEHLISKAAGDTVRWVMGETQQGEGVKAQTLVFVKPIRTDLRTNIVITTNERTYMIEAISHPGDAYTSILSWNYPRDDFAELGAAVLAAQNPKMPSADDADTAGDAVDLGGIALDRLHFNYAIKPVGHRRPSWMPTHVFDDGLKTYIQFAPDLDAGEAPPLFAIGEDGRAELVNYRMSGQYYVVDRLLSAAELRLGEKKQEVVRITRKGRRA